MHIQGHGGSIRVAGRRAATLVSWQGEYARKALVLNATLADVDSYWIEMAREVWLPWGGQTIRWRNIRIARDDGQLTATIEAEGGPEYV